MITFIDITESILYIRNKSKQRATAELKLKKNEQYEDLTPCTVEKEIPSLTETEMLQSDDSNSIFVNVLNAPTKEQTIIKRKEKKTQTLTKLRIIHQQMTIFSLMKIQQLLQIGLKLFKSFSFMEFLILEVK